MRKMKKLVSLVLAMVMVMAMTINVSAAEGDTYEIYQIFTGDYSDGVLSNVEWGKNGTGTEGTEVVADVLAALEAVKDETSDTKKLEVILDYADLNSEPYTTGTATKYENLPNGYYLVKNVDGSQEDKGEFYTLYIVEVVNGTLEFVVKGDAPSVDKEVDDPDANIGDTVTFTLTGTMPSDLNGYETYKVVFHDTLSAGLTYTNTVTVTIDGEVVTDDFNVTEPGADGKFTVSCDDVLALGAGEGSKVVVTYTAVLNENAVIGTVGNPNKVYLEYSNNPNWDGEGDEPTGDTPEDEVKVYTWEIPVFKYEGENTPLAGAGFTLYTDKDCTTEVNLVDAGNNIYKVCTLADCEHDHVTEVVTGSTGRFEIEGLQKGTYYLKETKTPAGYNTADVITVVIGENGTLTIGDATVTEVAVLNEKGTTLPETGGMGTTMFYLVGGALVVLAAVLLITRKRMSAE